MLTLDLNDENIILKMPDDKDPDDADHKPITAKEKKVQSETYLLCRLSCRFKSSSKFMR